MHGDPWHRLGWWWNNSWGTDTRRDVWVEHAPSTNTFRVRWRWGQGPEDHQTYVTVARAIACMKDLLGEEKSQWHEAVYLDDNGDLWDYTRPADEDRVIKDYFGAHLSGAHSG